MINFGSWTKAEITASFCFIPCEYDEMTDERSSLMPKASAYFSILSFLSFSPTPKISEMKVRYWIPVINSYKSGLSGI